jgi:hypothetical protein
VARRRSGESVKHEIKTTVTTRYDLRCTCGWRVITFDIYEEAALKDYHLDRMKRAEEGR